MPTSGKTILIIEDELAMRSALADKFSRQGFTILEAKNGQEGLAAALHNHPDLILLDIIMPVMDGMTMLRKLRESGDWGRRARVIILTNLSSDGNNITNNVTILEPSYYLIKADWKLEDLMAKVKEVLA